MLHGCRKGAAVSQHVQDDVPCGCGRRITASWSHAVSQRLLHGLHRRADAGWAWVQGLNAAKWFCELRYGAHDPRQE